jgi:glycosyltransferase involved in cell wall biosynthesis
MLDKEPTISLILTIKDGMPYLPDAIASLSRQSSKDFELIVQDCLSTDGSIEALCASPVSVNFVSEKDGGIGDAWNRAIRRAKGKIIGSIDSDNRLAPEVIERVIRIFNENPDYAVIYAGCDMINADGSHNSRWMPQEFDFLKLLSCDLVPPWSTAFFNRSICDGYLNFDPGLKTCVDYDIWLKASTLNIKRIPEYWGETRISSKSMTCRPESYEQFCRDKICALHRFLNSSFEPAVANSLFRYGASGIHTWASNSLRGQGAAEHLFLTHSQLASQYLDGKLIE